MEQKERNMWTMQLMINEINTLAVKSLQVRLDALENKYSVMANEMYSHLDDDTETPTGLGILTGNSFGGNKRFKI